MKRKLFLLILLALVINLAALIINMVSDEAEALCEKYIGEHYLIYLSILFIVLLVVSVLLANWEKIFNRPKKDQEEGSSRDDTKDNATEYTTPEVEGVQTYIDDKTYTAIEDAIAKDDLKEALALMRNTKVLRKNANNLLGRYKNLKNQISAGSISSENRTILMNDLRTNILDIIEPFQPLEKLSSTNDKEDSVEKIVGILTPFGLYFVLEHFEKKE